MATIKWPEGSVEKALEDLATALVPVEHALRYGLPFPGFVAPAEAKAQALLDAGGHFDELEDEYPHLADALYSVWNSGTRYALEDSNLSSVGEMP